MTNLCLVAEDEPALGEMICDNLRLEGHTAELVTNGIAALERLSAGAVDLLVLDIMLPGMDGFGVLEAMRSREDDTPVLILSARSSDADRIRGLELRADDYLTKPFNLRELLLRVDALLRRRTGPSPADNSVSFGGNRIDFRAQRATAWTGEVVELTATESRLLRLLTQRDGGVVSRREIVDRLFGAGTPPTVRTVDNVVLRLRKLFERDSSAPQHLHTIRGLGLRFDSGERSE